MDNPGGRFFFDVQPAGVLDVYRHIYKTPVVVDVPVVVDFS